MAGIKINFDITHNPEPPTLILANRNGNKIGEIDAKNITINDCMNTASELSFEVRKYVDEVKNELWEYVKNFKLVWCKEWDTWFEITVEVNESNETVKTVSGVRLGVAELSQIVLFDYQINTESDIERDDYKPTIFFDRDNPNSSLLHRLLEKAPHYSVRHIDSSIAKIQRTFEFDDISIYDAFQEIAQEIGCLFVFHSDSNINGEIQREFSVYDLESNCHNCGYRGEFTTICPECGSTEIKEGYGEDTTIFLNSEEITNDILFTSDTGAMKNCFKLEGGDDLMTAAIRSCNPNGTDYIWHRTKDMEDDMSPEMVDKLKSYDELYRYYQTDHISTLDSTALSKYNDLAEKYQSYNSNLETINSPIIGFPDLMTAYYNTIDLSVYLQSGLMPDASLSDTNAVKQAALLTRANLSPVAVMNLDIISLATVDNAVLGMAKVVIDSRYQVKINNSTLNNNTWNGNFVVTNYSDEEDTTISTNISIIVNDNYETYVRQKITKTINKEKVDYVNITGLFDLNYGGFCNELKKYCLDSLDMFLDICQSAIDVLIEQGVATAETWSGMNPNLYKDLYMPYYEKLQAIEKEMTLRQNEINVVLGVYNSNNELVSKGLQNYIIDIKDEIQEKLDFQSYMGKKLWLEFSAYRREDKFSNPNYISDGLNNAELFARALEFHKLASKEIYKSAELQHSISTSLKNLLLQEKFEPLLQHFAIGNWLRIQFDDKIYKLRLIKFEIDYSNIEKILIDFSDVLNAANGISDLDSILSQAKSMATSYDTIQRQAEQGAKGNGRVKNWIDNGLDATNTRIIGGADYQSQTWDSHGMLFKRYNPFTNDYDDTQLKVINSTLAITDDNWKTVKTAVGAFYYFDPVTNELKYAYGINAEVLIGKLILGNELGIYSDNNSMTFDNNGLKITNEINTFTVNPNHNHLISLSNSKGEVLWVDEKGMLHISGDGAGLDITANDTIEGLSSRLTVASNAITTEVNRATEAEGNLSSRITVTANSISSEVTRAKNEEEKLSSKITQTVKSIKLSVVNSTTSSTITLTGDGIETQSKIIKFTGDIVFASDLTDGTTKVSGSNIYGGTLTLGGSGNGYGKLNIYDSSNRLMGSWDNRGIFTNDTVIIGDLCMAGTVAYTLDVDSAERVKARVMNLGFKTSSTGTTGTYALNIGNPNHNWKVTEACAYIPFTFVDTVTMNKSLKVLGTKERVANTENYTERSLYAYEIASPIFGDIGEGITDENGECCICLDDIFTETVNTNIEYQVFLQKEDTGDIWVQEKESSYFIVKGTPFLKFAWEVKVRQKGYDYLRLENADELDIVQDIDYESQAAKMVQDYIIKMEGMTYE